MGQATAKRGIMNQSTAGRSSIRVNLYQSEPFVVSEPVDMTVTATGPIRAPQRRRARI